LSGTRNHQQAISFDGNLDSLSLHAHFSVLLKASLATGLGAMAFAALPPDVRAAKPQNPSSCSYQT